jgi:hypothetical protein
MKFCLPTLLLLSLIACHDEKKTNNEAAGDKQSATDTVIIKRQEELNEPNDAELYSKSYWYHWNVGEEQLPFSLLVSEYKKDGSVNVRLMHDSLLLFSSALELIKDGLRIAGDDFDLSKLDYMYFESPVYYPDLTRQLSSEYEQKFGFKPVRYERLNEFLMQASITSQLNSFLSPFNKKVRSYDIEKAMLVSRKGLGVFDKKGIDFSGYPEMMIDGFGLGMHLTSK